MPGSWQALLWLLLAMRKAVNLPQTPSSITFPGVAYSTGRQHCGGRLE